ncbi:Dynamin-N domain containing protein [Pyrenophora tritici-repentis]|uniref:Dynamin protein n=1 Tax=Pyrenophora tritici-repentis TaxID=45151 RepID=A0A2W1E183_9PLEO|nr:Dynamin-N domain-containing protein [Pyrenophora tritici-repentis]KAF7452558.1 Dynamin-N domain containing protein [Pyrenophora tritici-repentis]KAF7574305.1 Dynamin-N domain containing protein [Pyrenophora tritici-repentis]KAG9386893.1 Dynamin-N domain containing protein [Pyrenophora tritici-repentis]KAI0585088.1 Dynamin-N domain-containing protein [Pyrenophora tritici-repentis]
MRVVPIVSPGRVQKSMRNPRKRPAPDHLHPPPQPCKKASPERSIDPEIKGRIDQRISEYNTRIKTDPQSEHYHHDPREESSPGAEAYKPEFKITEEGCLQILRKLITIVKQDEHSELAVGLQSRTQEALHNYRGISENVAVVGKTGQGKSSLIEALLGVPVITKIGSSGEAVTRVLIIYSSMRADSVAKYEARVQLCDIATIRDSLRLHIANIISSLDKYDSVYTINDGDQEDQDMTVLADHRDQGDESMAALKGLFRSQPDFATDEAISSFMGFENSSSPKSTKSEDEIYNQCIAWAQDSCKEVTTKTKHGIFAAKVEDLWAQLAPYADFNEQDFQANSPLSFNPSLLVDRIEIIGDFRLKLSIGDCPGLGDINKDRETKANRYLRESQAVVVVEEISRAADSQFLADFLDQCHKRRPHQLVIVALSKSEANLNVKNRMNVAFTAHERRALDNLAVWKQEIIKEKKALGA